MFLYRCKLYFNVYQAFIALWQHNSLLQATQDDLPQILQDSLQHCLLTDVSKDTETGSKQMQEGMSQNSSRVHSKVTVI